MLKILRNYQDVCRLPNWKWQRTYWIKRVQERNFTNEIRALKNNEELGSKSKLKSISPFVDESGVIRVGGRLENSNLDFKQAHPIVLPDKYHLTDLIILHSHQVVGHGGIADTLNQIRDKFWLLKARRKIKSVLYNCNVCKIFRTKPVMQDMAPLPPDRCREAFPFENSGIDYVGPLYVKSGKELSKTYILLFTCAVTRAVHLELTTDLSTEKFLLAFRRFIARRGLCRIVYTDNAKTLKRAKKELELLNEVMKSNKVQDEFSKQGIKWKFIVERSAWWGGFWERMVQSVKALLKRILGKSSLTFRELETVITEVEAKLNFRPLTFTYSDLGEPESLTPGHFLIGRQLLSLPQGSSKLTSTKESLTRRFRHQQILVERIWRKWRQDYLMNLKSAHHSKLAKTGTCLKKGTIALVHEDKIPRLMGKMGIIMETFPGRDGKILQMHSTEELQPIGPGRTHWNKPPPGSSSMGYLLSVLFFAFCLSHFQLTI
ncbi:uncharacterized protein LOC118205505 [Stegodyphus dumicola]|uniref:uncharacterized protein LOC118205505 n=1 Tax=Stegodyphus dumicola TaxID=202533 RepID=UPI0015ADADEF|nr:uncharacterized protein LOC118205505 [Stegodyphus dumicola]